MKDLTQGSIAGHLISLAVPTAAGMLFQTLYYFVDLYFVAALGDAAVAGVSAAGNVMFIVMALTQVLGVGTMALISHAVGRKDQQDANLIFNQSLLIAALGGLLVLLAGYLITDVYLSSVAADEETIAHGRDYLYWFLPGMALQFALVAMSSALRGTGIVKPTMVVQALTVLLNTALAPILIAGWGTGYAMGVAGAGLASSIAIAIGVVVLTIYFARLEKYVSFHPEQWQPRVAVWKRMLTIGLPAGGEFALMFFYTAITYWAIRDFGAAAQAGFGIGSRIMQGIFLPAMAIAFVVAPVAGQNFGAKQMARVRETFRVAATQCVGVMLVVMVLCQWQPEVLVAFFTEEPEVIRVGALFLHLISWNFVMSGLIFTCSGLFQALGNTVPALVSSVTRLVVYALPLVWLTSRPGYQLEQVWYLSIAASAVQAVISVTLLRKQMRLQLGSPATQPA
ncbi:MATE family efflux transporter [Steroidobacter sp. S1-65]|uniref:MATE family efflux transporter n=1 Tax=Steroidobacter gossypii TaxID=2805490 RepID=A0ABS1X1V5_9GAMM|nr:MATE family efflux transporter [Steroidobacter gossypii]MBM0107218.1 MATE family efflux transporter [Steroidobacter gossypii]